MSKSTLLVLFYASYALAHMQMSYPPPRKSKFNPNVPLDQIDYSMTNPLLADGSNFPCKGYSKGPIVATFNAGDTIPIQMDGSVFHMGGHCQWSISYDDTQFLVLKTVMKDCFVGTGLNLQVTIPSTAPQCDNCTFTWSWVNAIGNREFYMNCADIKINNEHSGQLVGPKMVVANLPGFPTIPEFPPSIYDGSDLYENAPKITIGSGSTTSSTSTSSTSTVSASSTTTVSSTSTSSPSAKIQTIYKWRTHTVTVPAEGGHTTVCGDGVTPTCTTKTQIVYRWRPTPTC